MTPIQTLIERLIERAGGPVAAAELLGVSYNGSLAKWRRKPESLPLYMQHSIEAHLALSEESFDALLHPRRADVAFRQGRRL